MGQLVSDGKTFDVVAPDDEALVFGDLYRIDNLNGIALSDIGADDVARGLAIEADFQRIWLVALPAGVNPSAGDTLYWDDAAVFQAGVTDLVAAGDVPACFVVEDVQANDYCAVRVLNIPPAVLGS